VLLEGILSEAAELAGRLNVLAGSGSALELAGVVAERH
jgi:hypothetical protein